LQQRRKQEQAFSQLGARGISEKIFQLSAEGATRFQLALFGNESRSPKRLTE